MESAKCDYRQSIQTDAKPWWNNPSVARVALQVQPRFIAPLPREPLLECPPDNFEA
jgi:hypothetical protein